MVTPFDPVQNVKDAPLQGGGLAPWNARWKVLTPSHFSFFLAAPLCMALGAFSCSEKTPSTKERNHQPQIQNKAAKGPEASPTISIEGAKELCAKNFNLIFTHLYIDSLTDTKKVKFPTRQAEDFQKFKEDPNYWHLSYEPEAGLWLEARVSKSLGTVEWTHIGITAE